MIVLYILLLFVFNFVLCLQFDLGPHDEQCFYADVEQDASFTVIFQVEEGGFMDVDLTVYNPQGDAVFTRTREREGRYAFSAAQTGLYKACFSNKFSSITTKTLEFDVIMHDLETDDDQLAGAGFDDGDDGNGATDPFHRQQQQKESAAAASKLASHDDVSQISRGIMDLSEALLEVKSDQAYLRARERAHRNTNESTNARVLWWSIWEAVCIVCIALFQIFFLKRWFEVKRHV